MEVKEAASRRIMSDGGSGWSDCVEGERESGEEEREGVGWRRRGGEGEGRGGEGEGRGERGGVEEKGREGRKDKGERKDGLEEERGRVEGGGGEGRIGVKDKRGGEEEKGQGITHTHNNCGGISFSYTNLVSVHKGTCSRLSAGTADTSQEGAALPSHSGFPHLQKKRWRRKRS